MATVTISPKFQVVIPREVRQAMGLHPGEKMEVIQYQGRLELIPQRDIRSLRGFLKGVRTRFERDEDRL